MRRTNTRRMAARRAKPVARRTRSVAPRRGRSVASRRRGARTHAPGHNGMCPAGMMMSGAGQCVPISGGMGGYRRAARNTRPARGVHRKSGASLVYGGQNLVSIGGIQYDCPPGVTYVGGGCVPVSYQASVTS